MLLNKRKKNQDKFNPGLSTKRPSKNWVRDSSVLCRDLDARGMGWGESSSLSLFTRVLCGFACNELFLRQL